MHDRYIIVEAMKRNLPLLSLPRFDESVILFLEKSMQSRNSLLSKYTYCLLGSVSPKIKVQYSSTVCLVNIKALCVLFQMCVTGGLGIPGTREDRSTSRNAFVC